MEVEGRKEKERMASRISGGLLHPRTFSLSLLETPYQS